MAGWATDGASTAPRHGYRQRHATYRRVVQEAETERLLHGLRSAVAGAIGRIRGRTH